MAVGRQGPSLVLGLKRHLGRKAVKKLAYLNDFQGLAKLVVKINKV